MVRLNRIYTKTGDDGTTGLGDGSRRPKHDLRVAAYGTVDELSSVLGLVLAYGAQGTSGGALEATLAERLGRIQNDLFDVGADLCVPGEAGEKLRIQSSYTERLETWLDEVNDGLEPLKSFILPGGRTTAAWLHLARTTCRRAERLVSELAASAGDDSAHDDAVNGEVLRYLNRLSDYLFVVGRAENDGGKSDVLWQPGQNA